MINVYKPVGISPLDVINLLKEKSSEYKDVPVTYAGRLDPIAAGVLLLLAGDEVHKKEEYMKLDKEYEAEILLGFETDTYDILGISRLTQPVGLIEETLKNIVGEISLPLPPYSSYKIEGKPLFMWAREGKLSEIEIPMRTTTVHNAEVIDSYEKNSEELFKQITEKIEKVNGDFRQEEILKNWEYVLNNNKDQNYLIVKAKFNVSSGTYIRSIAHHLGGVLLGLTRTKVGDFDIKDSTKV
jgi:tRNA pseudouridine(55) synthase